nr:MAG TPA: hypothetical protein [Caudoviricetes sp.]DAY37486.1 MAG TPA: hypothetical protein [Caudoviricetes sp.]
MEYLTDIIYKMYGLSQVNMMINRNTLFEYWINSVTIKISLGLKQKKSS